MDGYLRKALLKSDMLKKGIKHTITILLFLSTYSCGNHDDDKSQSYLKTNFNSYSDIYSTLHDSISTYVDSLLGTFGPEYLYGWSIDSLICINSTKDKLFAITIEKKGIGKKFSSDDAMELLGKKINGKWYFFKGGGALTIPRDMYGFSEENPPSQYALSQIARKNMLEPALIKKNGEYVVSDKWIDDHFYNNGYGNYNNRAAYDSVHWTPIMKKWKEKIDTNEYKPLKKKTENSVL
jgi:hypothetical protein